MRRPVSCSWKKFAEETTRKSQLGPAGAIRQALLQVNKKEASHISEESQLAATQRRRRKSGMQSSPVDEITYQASQPKPPPFYMLSFLSLKPGVLKTVIRQTGALGRRSLMALSQWNNIDFWGTKVKHINIISAFCSTCKDYIQLLHLVSFIF